MDTLNTCLGLRKNIPRQLKKNGRKRFFSSWRKLISNFQKFDKKSEKSKFGGNRTFQHNVEIFDFPNFDFSDFLF